MQNVRNILAAALPPGAGSLFPVAMPDDTRDLLRRTATGELPGHSAVDAVLSHYLLLCADGAFDIAETGILRALTANIDKLPQQPEILVSLLNALFVVQRLDLVAALLKDAFAFPAGLVIAFEDSRIGVGVVRWDISPSGEHRFVFDAVVLRNASLRNEIMSFYWEFPLLAHYAAQGERETGSVLLNRGDIGKSPGLAYCGNQPDHFLIPDTSFVSTRGYESSRQVLARNQIAWQDRAPVAFWRGATTGMRPTPEAWRALERIKLCEIARAHQHTGLFDVGISGVAQFSDPAIIQEIMNSGLVLGRVPWEDWGRYKYLIDIDGNSSPWSNLLQRLLTGSPVLKVESSRGLLQWFYYELIPWQNYIPIAADMSDLLDKVRWLNRNDQFARKVGENGRAIAEAMTIEREMQRSVPVISSAFRYFRDPPAYTLPYGMPVRPTTGLPDVPFPDPNQISVDPSPPEAAGGNVPVVRVLRQDTGVRSISLTNVREEEWAYHMFDFDSCQLHPAARGQPSPELAVNLDLNGHTAFECEVSVENPLGYAVDFIVEVTCLPAGQEVVRTATTIPAGTKQWWVVPLGQPAHGTHRVALRTVMSADAQSSHQARANWMAPAFRG
jgi:hypothetical protein